MNKITILGLEGNANKLDKIKYDKIILRTNICKAKEILDDMDVQYTSLDYIYEKADDFNELDKMLADEVINCAKDNDILYIVPGSGVTLDGSVDEIKARYSDVDIIYSTAPEYHMLSIIKNADVSSGYSIIPASCITEGMFSSKIPLIISAIDNDYLLSDMKILLSNEYGDEHNIFIGDTSGYNEIPIHELDRYKSCDHNTMIYIPSKTEYARYDINDLENIFKKLRSPVGCPWDREQTHKSLQRYLLEECAEVLDAIDSEDMYQLNDELGDVLLQVLFHATIAAERGDFDMRDVCDILARKLIKRHPHVFSESYAENSEHVKELWDEIKK